MKPAPTAIAVSKNRYLGRLPRQTPLYSLPLGLVLLWAPAVCLSFWMAQTAQGQQPDPPSQAAATHGQLRELLRQLDADDLAQREKAEYEIVQLGTTVLQFLPTIDSQTSAELKMRLGRIRQILESFDSDNFFEASVVSLQGEMELAEALEKLTQLTGNAVSIQEGQEVAGQMTVQLDWQEVTFWEAMQDLLDQTSLRLVPFRTTANELVLAPRSDDNPVAAYLAGPYRIEPTSVACERHLEGQLKGQLRVNLQLSWEPRMEPMFMQVPMSSVSALLADELEIRAANPASTPEVRLNTGGAAASFELQLELPDRSTERIQRLTGQLIISVPGDRHLFRFEKLASKGRQTEKFGDVSVTLEKARPNGSVLEVRLHVQIGNPQGALESFRGWHLSNQAHLLKPDGSRLENAGLQTFSSGSNSIGVAYLFQTKDDPDSLTLIYESPSVIHRQSLDFELTDIPLP
jgi:hypothetical protein